jgi:L-lactate dehydrogenase complex protein LldE
VNVGLFIPCYMDQLCPDAAMASLKLLEHFGVNVEFPMNQGCCGQPMANTGCHKEAKPVAEKWVKTFADFDAVVCPSGSCTAMTRCHFDELIETEKSAYQKIQSNIYELSEFLVDVLKISELDSSFPHKVGLHLSCHGLRELRLGSGTERNVPPASRSRTLLKMVKDIELVELNRPDECCGFGGTFAVAEEAISCQMGRDRLDDHQSQGVEYIVGGDVSCLMHMEGLAKREKRPVKFLHFAEILAGGLS